MGEAMVGLEILSDTHLTRRRADADISLGKRIQRSPKESVELLLEGIIRRKSVLRWAEAWCTHAANGLRVAPALDTDVVVNYLTCEDPASRGYAAEAWLIEASNLPFYLPIGTVVELHELLGGFYEEVAAMEREPGSAEEPDTPCGMRARLNRLSVGSRQMAVFANVLRSSRFLGILRAHNTDLAQRIADSLAYQAERTETTVNNTRDSINVACVLESMRAVGESLAESGRFEQNEEHILPLLVSRTRALHHLPLAEVAPDFERLRWAFELSEVPERANWIVERPEETLLRWSLERLAGGPGDAAVRADSILNAMVQLQSVLREVRKVESYPKHLARAWRKGRRLRDAHIRAEVGRIRSGVKKLLNEDAIYAIEAASRPVLALPENLRRRLLERPRKGGSAGFRRNLNVVRFCLDEGVDKYDRYKNSRTKRKTLVAASQLSWQVVPRDTEDSEHWALLSYRSTSRCSEPVQLLSMASYKRGEYVVRWPTAATLTEFLGSLTEFLHVGTRDLQPELDIPLRPDSPFFETGLVLNLGGHRVGSGIPSPLSESTVLELSQKAFAEYLRRSQTFALRFCREYEHPPLREVRVCTPWADFGLDLHAGPRWPVREVYAISHLAMPSHIAFLYRMTALGVHWESELAYRIREKLLDTYPVLEDQNGGKLRLQI